MKKRQPKIPYIAFGIALLYNMAAIAIALGLYISMLQTPGGLGLQLIRLCLPIIAFTIVFLDLRFKYRELRAYHRAK